MFVFKKPQNSGSTTDVHACAGEMPAHWSDFHDSMAAYASELAAEQAAASIAVAWERVEGSVTDAGRAVHSKDGTDATTDVTYMALRASRPAEELYDVIHPASASQHTLRLIPSRLEALDPGSCTVVGHRRGQCGEVPPSSFESNDYADINVGLSEPPDARGAGASVEFVAGPYTVALARSAADRCAATARSATTEQPAAMPWDFTTVRGGVWADPLNYPSYTRCSWFHGAISREESEERLIAARAVASADSNLFLVREKDAGLIYALSVLSPTIDAPGVAAVQDSSEQTNEITHHLISRAKRSDGSLGSHWLVNNAHRLLHCKTLYSVLVELSRKGTPALCGVWEGSSNTQLPKLIGTPLQEMCTRSVPATAVGRVPLCDVGVGRTSLDNIEDGARMMRISDDTILTVGNAAMQTSDENVLVTEAAARKMSTDNGKDPAPPQLTFIHHDFLPEATISDHVLSGETLPPKQAVKAVGPAAAQSRPARLMSYPPSAYRGTRDQRVPTSRLCSHANGDWRVPQSASALSQERNQPDLQRTETVIAFPDDEPRLAHALPGTGTLYARASIAELAHALPGTGTLYARASIAELVSADGTAAPAAGRPKASLLPPPYKKVRSHSLSNAPPPYVAAPSFDSVSSANSDQSLDSLSASAEQSLLSVWGLTDSVTADAASG